MLSHTTLPAIKCSLARGPTRIFSRAQVFDRENSFPTFLLNNLTLHVANFYQNMRFCALQLKIMQRLSVIAWLIFEKKAVLLPTILS